MDSEPLLREDDARFVTFPIVYDDIWIMYKKALESFWRAEEVDLSKDLGDWNQLTHDEQSFISQIIAFFAASDGIVMENLACRFMSDIQIAEARSFYAMQILMESIHSEMYSLLIDTYIKSKDEKMKLFQSIGTHPSITRKSQWARQWITNASDFATRLIAFACVEGIFFSSSFASIYWIKKRGLMQGLTLSNEFISRDEALHTEFAILLYHKLIKKPSKQRITEIIRTASEIEKSFVYEILPERLQGMNASLMTQYVEFVADRLALQLGVDKIYGSSNPFPFMELISLDSKTNFFERTVSAYALANKSIVGDPFDLSTDF